MSNTHLPHDLSLTLNKKGYTKPSNAYYNIYNQSIFYQTPKIHSEAIWAPTFGEVIDWFKETYNMDVFPTVDSIEVALNKI